MRPPPLRRALLCGLYQGADLPERMVWPAAPDREGAEDPETVP